MTMNGFESETKRNKYMI